MANRDHAAAQMPGWMLRDHANLADAYKQHIHDGGESALGDFLRDEAARREAEERAANRRGEGSDPERTAADDALLFKGVDALPPPAPDEYARLKADLADICVQWPGLNSPRQAIAALDALRAERDAANKYADGLASALFNTRRGRDAAKADAKRLRDLNQMAQRVLARAFDRIHGLPRTSDTELANDISTARAALAQGGNDDQGK